ncbi:MULTISPECIES: NAD(P)/FAD-dependent oxidoreductase [Catenuloplanes]|uniref:Phytoene dehydrogenase-like protein n=1 Tax=Catenuloplanes niger TaxID=587534 RepID=A0AAE3ZJ47_9ACTN|nr:NAD(P)/FAD-dependent oxidoreductase [Catenuloplanes niger]MDR7320857.1 phytoene dehydrogenase-like protein [Catenuloplanes niger]
MVIGAGVAGLVAAVRLREAGRPVLVPGVRDRVGGKLLTETVDGVRLEIDGQWVPRWKPCAHSNAGSPTSSTGR